MIPLNVPTVQCVEMTASYSELAHSMKSMLTDGSLTLVRNFSLQPDELLDFGSSIGAVFEPVALPPDKEPGALTTIAENGELSSATNWHHDQSFAPKPPDWAMLLCASPGANVVPTVFADAAMLLHFLSDSFVDTLRTLQASHIAYYPSSGQGSDLGVTSATHPLIVPVEGGEEAFFATPATVDCIDGWSQLESQYLLSPLFQMLNWPELTVRHGWRTGDLLAWPNRRYPHRALPFESGSPRQLNRIVGHW